MIIVNLWQRALFWGHTVQLLGTQYFGRTARAAISGSAEATLM